MAVWTVMTKDVAGDPPDAAAGRAVFVREKFSWLTLLFAPLVLLRFRLWLAFAAYVAVAVLLGVAEALGGLPDPVGSIVMAGFHVLLAFELPAMRQRKLARKGYAEAGVIAAHDRETAEQRFFADWTQSRERPRAPLPPLRPQAVAPLAHPGVIGAFPGT